MEGGKAGDEQTVHLFRERLGGIAGAQAGFDVGDRDSLIERGEGAGERGCGVALHDDEIGLDVAQDGFGGGEDAGRERGKALAGLHEIEIDVGLNGEGGEHLVEHLAMLGGGEDFDVEGLRLGFETERERAELDGFGTRAEDEEDALQWLIIAGGVENVMLKGAAMTIQLDIPESVASSLRLPLPEVEIRLRTELAIALYGQGILSFGQASELAGVSRYTFGDLVQERGLPRHYTAEDLASDLSYARSQ